MPPQKKAVPPLSLPERPPSKVEQGLAAAERADDATDLVAEDDDAPLCGRCFPPTWAEVPAKFAGVSCVHGNWTRNPKA